MIVKVQKSIMTSHKSEIVLVYSKDRSVMGEFPLNKDIEVVMKDKMVAYFEAIHRPDGLLELINEASNQDW